MYKKLIRGAIVIGGVALLTACSLKNVSYNKDVQPILAMKCSTLSLSM